jgi:hypothetical protein
VCNSDEEDEEEAELRQETGFGNVIVVDNLPVVPAEKFEKLNNVVMKIFSQIGEIREGASPVASYRSLRHAAQRRPCHCLLSHEMDRCEQLAGRPQYFLAAWR